MTTMSLDEARKILGKDGDELSDEQLENMIFTLEMLARETIQAIISGKIELPSNKSEVIEVK